MSLKLTHPEKILRFRNFTLDLSAKTHIMGILNVTPDSFSDGGLFFDKDKAIRRGLQMEDDGADIIDIGGESTRPGSDSVAAEEELRRVIPVIEALSRRVSAPISIDTNKPYVAKKALEAGAAMINNIMGVNTDEQMARAAAAAGAVIALMHIKGVPKTMQDEPVYEDLLGEIIAALKKAVDAAQACGVESDRIIIDPGLGFGKTPRHNLEIIRRLSEFRALGKPVLIGPSRKAFIGATLGIKEPRERLIGTAAAVAMAAANGADIIRVHDVREMAQAVKLADAIYRGNV